MKYSVGQKVKIRSLEWYRDNVNRYGIIEYGKYEFFEPMNEYCGKVVTIKRIDDDNYRIDTDKGAFCWTDEMIEGLAEEETKPNIIEEAKTYWDSIKDAWICPEGYQFKDENGNIINVTKIVLEKKVTYPKTYAECCKVLFGDTSYAEFTFVPAKISSVNLSYIKGDIVTDLPSKFIPYEEKLNTLYKLLICRDAYWELYGEEMGLGKPWEPTKGEMVYSIYRHSDKIGTEMFLGKSVTFEFPTAEMRDAFKENFDPDIEFCKELL